MGLEIARQEDHPLLGLLLTALLGDSFTTQETDPEKSKDSTVVSLHKGTGLFIPQV